MSSENLAIDENSARTLGGVTDDANQFIKRLRVDPTTFRLKVSASGGVFSALTATGAVNGNNTSFTFTSLPTYIVSDHAWYKQTNSSGTTNWTWNAGTLTATLTIPSQEDIFGIA